MTITESETEERRGRGPCGHINNVLTQISVWRRHIFCDILAPPHFLLTPSPRLVPQGFLLPESEPESERRGRTCALDQSGTSIQVMWSLSTNQRPVSRSCYHSRPIRPEGAPALSTNQRPVSRSCDHSRPIRDQYQGHVITLDQSETSIQVMWSLSTNQRPVSRPRDHSRPIRAPCHSVHTITLSRRGSFIHFHRSRSPALFYHEIITSPAMFYNEIINTSIHFYVSHQC